jgi:hypothetical protein
MSSKKHDMIKTISKDQLQVSIGLITRSKAEKFKDAFNELIQSVWPNVNFKETTYFNM